MDDPDGHEAAAVPRFANRALEAAEAAVYLVIAALLLVLAASVLWQVVQKVPALFEGDEAAGVGLEVLDTLLLVFIVVELLFAVRMTLVNRELVAEPFLLVGIIASIKEIVVLSVKAAELLEDAEQFRNAVLEVAVLGLLIIVLGATAWLLRAKETKPDETSDPVDAETARAAEAGEPADDGR